MKTSIYVLSAVVILVTSSCKKKFGDGEGDAEVIFKYKNEAYANYVGVSYSEKENKVVGYPDSTGNTPSLGLNSCAVKCSNGYYYASIEGCSAKSIRGCYTDITFSEYKEIWKREVGSDEQSVASLVEKSVEILFKRRNGVTEVNCSINGLPLYFIFDTGAGDVTISSVEAAFMFKNGYLSEKDVIGRKNYRTASGDIVEGTLINLSTIEIGELSLSNVRASVVKGQNAPLLLGQSVLSRLGKVEIDNANQKIKITYQESK